MRKVLIANRGEIAVRLILACRELGLDSVAVYAGTDADAPHVWLASEAIALPGNTSADTYLNPGALLAAAAASGADALHPGYGFLSEDAAFAGACQAAGLIWVGPPPAAIAALGHKRRARERVAEAGVPVLPGGPIDADAANWPGAESFPLMVKAATGGGGLGLRHVENPEDFAAAVDEARAQCRAAFWGCGGAEEAVELYWEAYVTAARHLEVQVVADHHGAIAHLGERECSVQRRHQKIVEECPSPALDAAGREALGELATRAAAAVGYANVGTVEFLWTRERGPMFIEMNTRLQVEHPVTELVWGVDLPQIQLRLATGERLAAVLGSPAPRGHAIEARVYAEDPVSGMPAPGRIDHLRWPTGPWVRVDAGIEAGMTLSPYFDSLLAKVVTWGPDRASARHRLADALDRTELAGTLVTNMPRLRAVLAAPAFAAGAVDTQWLERDCPEGLPLDADASAVAVWHGLSAPSEQAAGSSGRPGWARRAWR